jgi:hypothetical protein
MYNTLKYMTGRVCEECSLSMIIIVVLFVVVYNLNLISNHYHACCILIATHKQRHELSIIFDMFNVHVTAFALMVSCCKTRTRHKEAVDVSPLA